jgi:probable selenium-dependent hydroxylase accessory protein YqeC
VGQSLIDAFGLPEAGVISIVGAGGKTTLMFRLAGELARVGHRVLTTTSTKIFRPNNEQSSIVMTSNDPIDVVRFANRYPMDGFHLLI